MSGFVRRTPEYLFPVSDPHEALEVTDLVFDIEPFQKQLYMDLDSVRSTEWRDEVLFSLNIENGALKRQTSGFFKFIFSGHRGCGKSTELIRLHHEINRPDGYLSMFINLESELLLPHFRFEDFYILLVTTLAKTLRDLGAKEAQVLDQIAKEWLNDTEIRKELKETFKLEMEAHASAGATFFSLASLRVGLRNIFNSESQSIRTIRERISRNPAILILQLNLALTQAREYVIQNGKGRDLLFVLDGSERMNLESYRLLFIEQASLLQQCQVHILCSIPINAFFDIQNSAFKEFFNSHILPMIKLTAEGKIALKDLLGKRILIERLLTAEALDYIVEMSGGSLRQLLRIVNRAIVGTRGRVIDQEAAEKTCRALGQQMRDLLDSEHFEILKKQALDKADPKVNELLFHLLILKYNGSRKINPLLEKLGFLE